MTHRAGRIHLLATLFATLLMGGCATLPEGSTPSEKDPWERYNRTMHSFNQAVDRSVLRPVAKGYRTVTPDPVEHAVSNFFSNLSYPIVVVNQFLQGDFKEGASDLGRFLFNSVIGVGGLFDPATSIGLEQHDEDFGQTLAVWGVPQGPYLVLPFLGPSTLRDSVGTYADSQVNPLFETFGDPEQYYLLGLKIVDLRAQLLGLDSQLDAVYDPYAFLRDAYLQRREYQVHDGSLPQPQDYYDDLYDDLESFDDFDTEAPQDAAPVEGNAAGEEGDGEQDPPAEENQDSLEESGDATPPAEPAASVEGQH